MLLGLALQRWLLVNDIHLDPFFRQQTIVGAGDTTPLLWRTAVESMRRDVPNPGVVVIGGDLLAHVWRGLSHDAGEDPVRAAVATMREIAGDLGATYPHARFLIALGNNDDPCGDYRSEDSGAYQRAITSIWAPLVERGGGAPDFADRFYRGGYYVAALPHGERAIVLNSVFWSFANRSGCASNTRAVGPAELSWFDEQLARTPRGERDVIVMHVPPGYDGQTTATLAHDLIAVPFLAGAANDAVLSAFVRNRDRIAFAIGAHTHHYDFRIVSGVPMIVGSSISPVYGNAPAFYELDIGPDGSLDDVVPFVLNPYAYRPVFTRRESFDAYYGIVRPTAESLAELAQRIRDDAQIRAQWVTAHETWAHVRHDASWLLPNECAQTELDGGYDRCAHIGLWDPRRALGAAALAAALIALIVVMTKRLRNRAARR